MPTIRILAIVAVMAGFVFATGCASRTGNGVQTMQNSGPAPASGIQTPVSTPAPAEPGSRAVVMPGTPPPQRGALAGYPEPQRSAPVQATSEADDDCPCKKAQAAGHVE